MKTITEFRKERGWSHRDLAAKLGVNEGQVFRWEHEKNRPRDPQLRQMAELFGVSIDDIKVREAAHRQSSRAGSRSC